MKQGTKFSRYTEKQPREDYDKRKYSSHFVFILHRLGV